MPAVFSSLSFTVVALIAFIIVAVVAISSASAQPDPLPKVIDWRKRGVIGAVPDQGECATSSIFAAISNIQAVSAITNGDKLVDLSYKELELCMDNGCNGGLMNDAFKWVLDHGGRVAPASVVITEDKCKETDKLPVGARIESVRSLAHSETEIHRALVSGPVFVGVDATSWQVYSGGVNADCSFNQIDHAALVVGVNLDYSTPYWILQNSWGADWGEDGYIRVKYGSNECGINSYPITVSCAKL